MYMVEGSLRTVPTVLSVATGVYIIIICTLRTGHQYTSTTVLSVAKGVNIILIICTW